MVFGEQGILWRMLLGTGARASCFCADSAEWNRITMANRRVVIVTGAAGTIGIATATELERQDWQVIRLDREEDVLRRTVGVNLAAPADIRRCFRRIEDE